MPDWLLWFQIGIDATVIALGITYLVCLWLDW